MKLLLPHSYPKGWCCCVFVLYFRNYIFVSPMKNLMHVYFLVCVCVCFLQGPPSVSPALHATAVYPLVSGTCRWHWCNSTRGSGPAPQKPALQANRYQHARLHPTGKLGNDNFCVIMRKTYRLSIFNGHGLVTHFKLKSIKSSTAYFQFKK